MAAPLTQSWPLTIKALYNCQLNMKFMLLTPAAARQAVAQAAYPC